MTPEKSGVWLTLRHSQLLPFYLKALLVDLTCWGVPLRCLFTTTAWFPTGLLPYLHCKSTSQLFVFRMAWRPWMSPHLTSGIPWQYSTVLSINHFNDVLTASCMHCHFQLIMFYKQSHKAKVNISIADSCCFRIAGYSQLLGNFL